MISLIGIYYFKPRPTQFFSVLQLQSYFAISILRLVVHNITFYLEVRTRINLQ